MNIDFCYTTRAIVPFILAACLTGLAFAQPPRMAKTAADFTAALSQPVTPPAEITTRGAKNLAKRGPAGIVADPERDDYQQIAQTLPKAVSLIHFDYDSTRINDDDYAILDALADALHSDLADAVLMIAGHTDSRGSESYNLKLSQRRAQAVKDYLVTRGIASRRLTARGYGEAYPLDSNATPNGRTLNRRSEFIRVGNL